jgi:hypothetical protein
MEKLLDTNHVITCAAQRRVGSMYQYDFWSLNQSLSLLSVVKFNKGDTVKIKSVQDYGLIVQPAPAAVPERALLFVRSAVPLNCEDQYTLHNNNCDIVVQREATLKGNRSFLMVASVPLKERSSIHGINQKRERFIFSFFP